MLRLVLLSVVFCIILSLPLFAFLFVWDLFLIWPLVSLFLLFLGWCWILGRYIQYFLRLAASRKMPVFITSWIRIIYSHIIYNTVQQPISLSLYLESVQWMHIASYFELMHSFVEECIGVWGGGWHFLELMRVIFLFWVNKFFCRSIHLVWWSYWFLLNSLFWLSLSFLLSPCVRLLYRLMINVVMSWRVIWVVPLLLSLVIMGSAKQTCRCNLIYLKRYLTKELFWLILFDLFIYS